MIQCHCGQMHEPCCPWCQTALGDHQETECLNVWVATTVLGCHAYLYRRCPRPFWRCGCQPSVPHEEDREELVGLRKYSGEMDAAWQVVEQMQAHRTIHVSLDNNGLGYVFHIWKNGHEYAEGAHTAPLAIVKAALRACLEEQCEAATGTQEELRTPNTVEYIIRLIGALGSSDRRALFEDQLPAEFCMYCGSKRSRESPKCYCQADEQEEHKDA